MTASYFITNSGQKINLTSLSIEDIYLGDICHGLTKICRYGSSLPLDVHYSVAQHSILVCIAAQLEGHSYVIQRACFTHDFSEYLLGDVVNGLKQLLPDYKALEEKVTNIINIKYNIELTQDIERVVKQLDKRILLNEVQEFSPQYYDLFESQLGGLGPINKIMCINEIGNLEATKINFLRMCELYDIKD